MLANPRADRVKKVASLVGRSARNRSGLILVEGPQSVRELLAHRPSEVVDVYVSEEGAAAHRDILELAHERTRWVHSCTREVIHEISGDAQGILAVAKSAAILSSIDEAAPGSSIALIAQGRDPGNVGTIIRTADAMGAAGVITVAGTVEVSNPKVLRSSAGSAFHLPIVRAEDFESAVRMVHSLGGRVLGTSGGLGTRDLVELLEEARTGEGPLAGTHAWAFGNEARGLSEGELAACDALVSIPMTGAAESLNVASAAAMCLFGSQSLRSASFS